MNESTADKSNNDISTSLTKVSKEKPQSIMFGHNTIVHLWLYLCSSNYCSQNRPICPSMDCTSSEGAEAKDVGRKVVK